MEIQYGTVGPQIDFEPANGVDRYLPGGAKQVKFADGQAITVSELVSFKQMF